MSAIALLRRDSPGSPDPTVLLAALEAFPESLAIVPSGRIVYANPAWREMFECIEPSRLLGHDVDDLVIGSHSLSITPAMVPELAAANLEVSRAGFQVRGSEFQVVHTRDVGRLKQIESQLQEAQRLEAVGRLVGGVAHDFNNLLTGMLLYCDLLIGELAKDSSPRRHAQEMRTAGEHGAALVQQLLAVTRPPVEASGVFALNDVVTGIEDLLKRLVGENIVLDIALATDLGPVRMDPAQVQQILLNLVLNARDAIPDGGCIAIITRNCSGHLPSNLESASQSASWVELVVADTGGGMDAETLDRAFEPFFTTKTPGRGNGLGLATARRLAQREGGTISAESQPGKGTRISVRLPRAQPDSPPFANSQTR